MPLTEGWKVERPLFVRNGNTPAARSVMASQSAVQISDVHGGEVYSIAARTEKTVWPNAEKEMIRSKSSYR
ncbi:hypothetical protein CRENBAI_017750 [Crenichthys baileyi]|uniref:Uncharacterized protein n=1 Tax=Crenichthys baileyi TaxID=28760 RepID=A0AAV9SRZ0_9TELE